MWTAATPDRSLASDKPPGTMRYRRPESTVQVGTMLTSVRRHLGKIFHDIFSAT
ncbi:hypothetical protein [Nocardia asiatica]|uniref:hypothetical protein n=1 Tax=Nocardia asiatica TaxID=209252 RepID=UPI0024569AC5|nr:hypothetical protein [Nocardia asiatica]